MLGDEELVSRQLQIDGNASMEFDDRLKSAFHGRMRW